MKLARRWLRYPAVATRGLADSCRPPKQSVEVDESSVSPSIAPKPTINLKHIRENADLYEKVCLERKYPKQAENVDLITIFNAQRLDAQKQLAVLRKRAKDLYMAMAGNNRGVDENKKSQLLREQIRALVVREKDAQNQMIKLALEMPNLTSEDVPRGDSPVITQYINEPPASFRTKRTYATHVQIGTRLGIIDTASAANSSGWGWYYLVGDGVRLEQALVQYALSVASRRSWTPVSPPSIVFSHIETACGFSPRDRNNETQVYKLQQSQKDQSRGVPQQCLAGTSEIPLAAMMAKSNINPARLPLRRVAVSRCYRAEAGSRGAETKGLYRVHEFTKVELFAWTAPDSDSVRSMLNEMVEIQKEVLTNLGLHCRVLVMPAADLGAAATYKIDIEAFFPGRRCLEASSVDVESSSDHTEALFKEAEDSLNNVIASIKGTQALLDVAKSSPQDAQALLKDAQSSFDDAQSSFEDAEFLIQDAEMSATGGNASPKANDGWGEVTSASICTDYQTRRLATRLWPALKLGDDTLHFPFTANATALAVPRVLAALLENGWDPVSRTVAIPLCLRPWMNGRETIGMSKRRRRSPAAATS
ncbi:hypothetical protein CDD82_3603 [Ophiocordyceps australis]|uniref:serine--tRNA ligase n=1 Tax=Ophiocordyceps australis TaxID=1399860 RepID=A0A2C5ZBG6_9HYPO|nr:hypothetical protein CDD82_3603 [Ophiocordyceps australis]